jgi:hypothetical protein
MGEVLARLLRGRKVKLNLIPYNPNFAVGIMEFDEPTEEDVSRPTGARQSSHHQTPTRTPQHACSRFHAVTHTRTNTNTHHVV